MNVLILSSAPNAVGAISLCQSYGKSGHKCVIQKPGTELDKSFIPDVVIPRFSPNSLEPTLRAIDSIKALFPEAIVLAEAEAIRLSFDKLTTYKCFVANNVPTPYTWHKSIATTKAMKLPVIAKPTLGSRGNGIVIIRDTNTLNDMANRDDYIVQEFIQNTSAHDIRAFVIGDKVVASMKRTAPADEYITNLAVGGTAEPIALDEDTKAIAVRACQSLGLTVGGVDLILSGDDYLVLEVNPSPGFKVGDVCSVDIPAQLVEYTESLLKETQK